jgi:diguanylate cyclase (GGDEF)-like protein
MRRLAPFAVAGALPFAMTAAPGSASQSAEVLVAAALALLVGCAVVFAPWQRLPGWLPVVPALAFLLAVALLRDAGGIRAGVGPAVLLPIVWMALHGTRAHLLVVVAGVAAVFLVPTFMVGEPAYPAWAWRLGVLFFATSAVIGLTIHQLITRVRAEARERGVLLARLEDLAHTDELTGLPNRRGWDASISDALAQAEVTARPVCVAVLDLDSFKELNDLHGHAHGDRLLKRVAAAWSAELRPQDVIARLGGDEFAILLPGCSDEHATPVIERLRRSEAGAISSAGLAGWDGSESAADLLNRADQALYRAKRTGRDRTVTVDAIRVLHHDLV